MFWGEWEAETRRERALVQDDHGLPARLLRPELHPIDPAQRLNTDPSVFGGFRYTVCQQHKHRPRRRGKNAADFYETALHALAPRSLILFGSKRTDARGLGFALDTVFVVGESWLHDASNWTKLAVPSQYRDLTLGPLRSGTTSACCRHTGEGWNYRLYSGLAADESEGPHSFFPCLVDEGQARGFRRPMLRLRDFPELSTTKTQGYSKVARGEPGIRALWNRVHEQVELAGLAIGVRANFPD